MINHARTLLLNRAAKNNHITADTAAEFVPTEFFPVNLTNELRLIRRSLFGSQPDARFINLRVRELMGYVHQTEFASYVYDLDKRVTYWPTQVENFETAARSQTTVTQLFGPPQPLTVIGAFQPNPSVGVAMRQYVATAGTQAPTLPMTALRLTSPDTANTVVAIQELGTVKPPEVFAAGTGDTSAAATLPQTNIKLLLNFAQEPSEYAQLLTELDGQLLYESYAATGPIESEQLAASMPVLSGIIDSVLAQWLVTIKAVPQPVITTMLPTLELLGEPVFLSLFGINDVEPYVTFKNLWFDHYSPVYRLAGLTLAVIYRTEELRRYKNGE